MSRPSMTALLALLAIAGYQNRDKIAEMLGGLGKKDPGAKGQVGQNEPEAQAQDGLGGLLSQLDAGGASAAGMLSGGLGELLESFNKSGQGEIAKSWVSTGPNKQCTADELKRAITGYFIAADQFITRRAANEA
jgi:uncharacterized protein YidB (DUF937 family)